MFLSSGFLHLQQPCPPPSPLRPWRGRISKQGSRGGSARTPDSLQELLGGSFPKRDRAPRLLPRGARGEAPESGWIFWIYPWKGAMGMNKREGMRSEISRDGRMNSGWSATSPYVRGLRCLYSMQRLCLKWSDRGRPRRIRGLRRALPVSLPGWLPVPPLRSCNCFLSLMAFLQIYRVPA